MLGVIRFAGTVLRTFFGAMGFVLLAYGTTWCFYKLNVYLDEGQDPAAKARVAAAHALMIKQWRPALSKPQPLADAGRNCSAAQPAGCERH